MEQQLESASEADAVDLRQLRDDLSQLIALTEGKLPLTSVATYKCYG